MHDVIRTIAFAAVLWMGIGAASGALAQAQRSAQSDCAREAERRGYTTLGTRNFQQYKDGWSMDLQARDRAGRVSWGSCFVETRTGDVSLYGFGWSSGGNRQRRRHRQPVRVQLFVHREQVPRMPVAGGWEGAAHQAEVRLAVHRGTDVGAKGRPVVGRPRLSREVRSRVRRRRDWPACRLPLGAGSISRVPDTARLRRQAHQRQLGRQVPQRRGMGHARRARLGEPGLQGTIRAGSVGRRIRRRQPRPAAAGRRAVPQPGGAGGRVGAQHRASCVAWLLLGDHHRRCERRWPRSCDLSLLSWRKSGGTLLSGRRRLERRRLVPRQPGARRDRLLAPPSSPIPGGSRHESAARSAAARDSMRRARIGCCGRMPRGRQLGIRHGSRRLVRCGTARAAGCALRGRLGTQACRSPPEDDRQRARARRREVPVVSANVRGLPPAATDLWAAEDDARRQQRRRTCPP